MRLRKISHPLLRLLVLCVSLLVLLFWVGMRWDCPFRRCTGVPCPACGMSRAWLAALHLDIAGALRMHPLFWVVPLAAGYALYGGQPFHSQRVNRAVGIGMLAAILLCWGIRLTAFFRGQILL